MIGTPPPPSTTLSIHSCIAPYSGITQCKMQQSSPTYLFVQQITVLRDGKVVFSLPVEFEPQCAAVHPGQTEVAVGGKTVG